MNCVGGGVPAKSGNRYKRNLLNVMKCSGGDINFVLDGETRKNSSKDYFFCFPGAFT